MLHLVSIGTLLIATKPMFSDALTPKKTALLKVTQKFTICSAKFLVM